MGVGIDQSRQNGHVAQVASVLCRAPTIAAYGNDTAIAENNRAVADRIAGDGKDVAGAENC